jgi:hypothetical protein
MLYLGIDQHARRITISLRDEQGDVLLARQVSTQPKKINEFFQRFTRGNVFRTRTFLQVRRQQSDPSLLRYAGCPNDVPTVVISPSVLARLHR